MIEQLLKAQRAGKTVFGKEKVMKLLQSSGVEEVFVSATCPAEVVERIQNFCGLANAKFNKLEETSEEIGIACKKPFQISVAAVVKVKEK